MKDPKKKILHSKTNSKTPKNEIAAKKKKSLRLLKDSKVRKVVEDESQFMSCKKKLTFANRDSPEEWHELTPISELSSEEEVFCKHQTDNPYVVDEVSVASGDYVSGDSEEEEQEEEEEEEQDEEEEEEEELEEEEGDECNFGVLHPPVKCSKAFLENRRKRLNAFSN